MIEHVLDDHVQFLFFIPIKFPTDVNNDNHVNKTERTLSGYSVLTFLRLAEFLAASCLVRRNDRK